MSYPISHQIAPSLYGLKLLIDKSEKKAVDGILHANKASKASGDRPILFQRAKQTIRNWIQDTFEGKKRAQTEVCRILNQAALKTRNKRTLGLIDNARNVASKSRSLKDLRGPINQVIKALEQECAHERDFNPDDPPFAVFAGIEKPLTDSNLYGPLLKAADGNLEPLVELMSTSLGQALSNKDFPKQIDILLKMEEKAAKELVNRSPALALSVAKEIVQKAIDQACKPLFGFVDPTECEGDKDTGKSGNIKSFSTPGNPPKPFSRVKMFENGGFGSAGLYESGDAEVVLKWAQSNSNSKSSTEDNCAMLREALHQYQAHAKDARTVMELKHLVRTPGGWALAMEAGKLGSLWDVSNSLGDDPQARQFLARQCVQIAQTLEASGVRHLDLKEPNIFLLDDATAKVADFGTATTDQRARTLDIPDNPAWFPPDARQVVNSVKNEISVMEKRLDKTAKALKDLRVDLKKKGEPIDQRLELEQEVNRLGKEALDPAIKKLAEKAEFSSDGVDRWGLGIILLNVLTRKTDKKVPVDKNAPFEGEFLFEAEEQFKLFQSAKNPTMRKTLLGRALNGQPEPIKKLIVDLLDPNPEKRKAPSEIELGVFGLVSNLTPKDEKAIRDRIKKAAGSAAAA